MIREQLLKQKRLFTERLEQQDSVLTPTEERRLIEIDEGIEAIDLAIDYQNNIINKRERDIQQSIRASQVKNFLIIELLFLFMLFIFQGSESPLFKIGQLNENESKELCRKLFEKVIDLKENDNKNQREFVEIKSQLTEQTETINELQSRIQTLAIDHDRRLTAVQQNHEEEKQLLFGQLQDSSNQIKDLERDLYFYKHKTRELRKSMATSTTTPNILDTSTSSTTSLMKRKESNSNDDDFPTQIPTPRTAVQQQQSAPFLLKIGNRSNSAHQFPQDEIKKR